jgi:hypothetical protein
MIAITTNSSTNVNPSDDLVFECFISFLTRDSEEAWDEVVMVVLATMRMHTDDISSRRALICFHLH